MQLGRASQHEEDIEETGASIQVVDPSSLHKKSGDKAKKFCGFFILIMVIDLLVAFFPND